MLEPLDPQRLSALAREDDVDEGMDFTLHHRMSTMRSLVTECEDWCVGVRMLLEEGGRFMTSIERTKHLSYEERQGSDDWYLEFLQYPFQDLSVHPSPGGVIDICTFGKCLKSFQIMGCRKNWPALVEWIWHYGNRIDIMRSKQKGRAGLVEWIWHYGNRIDIMRSKQKGQKTSRGKRRRVEKSLLHQVLHPAKLKAHRGRKPPAKDDAAAGSPYTDIPMNDADTTTPLCHTAFDTASSNGPDDQRTPTTTTEDVDISTLKVADRDP